MRVLIRDADGTVLADVDAQSTADALAYYLSSRRISTVTEEGIGEETGTISALCRVSFRHSDPITGAVEIEIEAIVKDPAIRCEVCS